MKRVNVRGAQGWEHKSPGANWGVNESHTEADLYGVPIHASFQMHSEEMWRGGRNGPAHAAWLAEKHSFPIYMQQKHPDVPASRAFPRKRTDALWPFATDPVYSDSFCYMVALAIATGYKHIHLDSVFLQNEIEVYTEAPAFCMWLTIAATRGIKVTEWPSRFLAPFSYGYEPRKPAGWLPQGIASQVIVDENLDTRLTRRDYYRAIREFYERPRVGQIPQIQKSPPFGRTGKAD